MRVIKHKQLMVNARFTDVRFGDTRHALYAAIINILNSGLAWPSDEVQRLSHSVWLCIGAKRSGIGLCAVAYFTHTGRGRGGGGGTFSLSAYKRIASGRGMDKFRLRLIAVLQTSVAEKFDKRHAENCRDQRIRADIDAVLMSGSFRLFLCAGKQKADHIVVADYLASLNRG